MESIEETTEIRDEKGRIKPGYTLNPGGRPRKKNFGDYFNETEKEALILRIKQELQGEPKGDIVKMVVEQIFGKPKQPVVGGDEGDNPIVVKQYTYGNSNPTPLHSETIPDKPAESPAESAV